MFKHVRKTVGMASGVLSLLFLASCGNDDVLTRIGEIDQALENQKTLLEQQQQTADALQQQLDGQQETALAVDMGTTVLWANYNLGATANGEVGNFYAWAETTAKRYFDDNYVNYKYYDAVNDSIVKYGANKEGYLAHLELMDDAAYQALGGKWHLPTMEDFEALLKVCDKEEVMVGVVKCIRFTSNVTGNSLYFPYGGYRQEEDWHEAGIAGSYWTRCNDSTEDFEAYYLYLFYDTDAEMNDAEMYSCSYYCGLSIRPVCDR